MQHGGRGTLRSVPFRWVNALTYLSLLQPGSAPDPSPGCAQESTPKPLFISVQTWEQGETSHPFRQKYLLECWVCTRLNLFKELAILETYVWGFSSRCGVRLVKKCLSFCDTHSSISACLLGSVQANRHLQLEILHSLLLLLL